MYSFRKDLKKKKKKLLYLHYKIIGIVSERNQKE